MNISSTLGGRPASDNVLSLYFIALQSLLSALYNPRRLPLERYLEIAGAVAEAPPGILSILSHAHCKQLAARPQLELAVYMTDTDLINYILWAFGKRFTAPLVITVESTTGSKNTVKVHDATGCQYYLIHIQLMDLAATVEMRPGQPGEHAFIVRGGVGLGRIKPINRPTIGRVSFVLT